MPAFPCRRTTWAWSCDTKCAAWLSAGFGFGARTTGFSGEKNVRRTFARSLELWARAAEGKTAMHTRAATTMERIEGMRKHLRKAACTNGAQHRDGKRGRQTKGTSGGR